MKDVGIWVMCKVLECGLYVIPWNVGYISDLGMWVICNILKCGYL